MDRVIYRNPKQFIGSNETFVFTLEPEKKTYYSTDKNDRFCLAGDDYFQFGGNGSAIYVNESMQGGQARESETFDCPQITQKDFFDIATIEIILLK